MTSRALALLLTLLAACAHGGKAVASKGACPAKPVCLTALKCQYDGERDCDVCQCHDSYLSPGAEPPPGQAPFPR